MLLGFIGNKISVNSPNTKKMKRKPSEISNIKDEVLASELLDNEFSGDTNEF